MDKPEAFEFALCLRERHHECPGINATHDRCSCDCHPDDPTDEELEAMRTTLEKPHVEQ